MAFLDFLSQPTGGYQQAQGPNMTGGAGVGAPQPVGPTWGQLGQAAIQYGSKPGSSGPLLAGTPQAQGVIQPLQPTAMMETPEQKKKKEGGSSDSLAAISQLLVGLFGGI